MLDKIKQMLGLRREEHFKHLNNGAFIVSNYPEKGWTIKNPSFFHNGSWFTISWVKIADYQASGTDQFKRRVLPLGLFNYSGLHMEEFTNCGISLSGAEDAKAELESFVNALSEAKNAKMLVKHDGKKIELDLSKIHLSDKPQLKTLGPKGGKKKGYMEELNLNETEMKKVCNEVIVS